MGSALRRLRLARAARALNARTGSSRLPPLIFMTDEIRTPDLAFQGIDGLADAGLRSSIDDDLGAEPRQFARRRIADARGRACDEGDPAREVQIHVAILLCLTTLPKSVPNALYGSC